MNDTKFIVKEGDRTLQSPKEPSTNLYQELHNAGVSLGRARIVVKDITGINPAINILATVMPVVGILFVGVFWAGIFYILYLVIRALRKYLSS